MSLFFIDNNHFRSSLLDGKIFYVIRKIPKEANDTDNNNDMHDKVKRSINSANRACFSLNKCCWARERYQRQRRKSALNLFTPHSDVCDWKI